MLSKRSSEFLPQRTLDNSDFFLLKPDLPQLLNVYTVVHISLYIQFLSFNKWVNSMMVNVFQGILFNEKTATKVGLGAHRKM